MKHRLIIALLSVAVIAVVVGGGLSVGWRPGSTLDPKPTTGISSTTLTLGPSDAEAQPTLRIPRLYPSFVVATEPRVVTVSVYIPEESLIPASVDLQRVTSDGKVLAILGTLRDAGENGDEVAGDRIFAIRATLAEATEGQIYLRISAAFRGLLKRSLSPVVVLPVSPVRGPEDTINQFVEYLLAGDTEAAAQMVAGERNAERFRTLPPNVIADIVSGMQVRRLLEATEDHRYYEAVSTDTQGRTRTVRFRLIRNDQGEWRIRF